jgi:hypothetical protein
VPRPYQGCDRPYRDGGQRVEDQADLRVARVFFDPHATEFFRDWDKIANDTVALLRAEAGRDPYDRQLSDLIGELSTRSNEFRRRWGATTCGSPPPA